MGTTPEANEALTATGPGTVMGGLFRSYWLPVLPSSDLQDGPTPRRVQLLGEQLVLYRPAPGEVAMIEEFCAHRGASLYYGMCDAEGIQCPFHGWKYAPDGQCVEMPNEPAHSKYKERIKMRAYPAIDRGGIIWAYLGHEEPPEPPLMEWVTVGEDQRVVTVRVQATNYLQAMEGALDTSHASILHSDKYLFEPRRPEENPLVAEDTRPKFTVTPTEFGESIASERKLKDGRHYFRITQWVMPCFTLVAPLRSGVYGGHAFVPKNDTECWVWSFDYRPERPLTQEDRRRFTGSKGLHAELVPGTYERVLTSANDYRRDSRFQRMGSVTGIVGIANQDSAVQESMGPIVDRSREHLGTADIGIITVRRRLLTTARQLASRRMDAASLPGRDPGAQLVRSASALLDEGEPWRERTAEEQRVPVKAAPLQ